MRRKGIAEGIGVNNAIREPFGEGWNMMFSAEASACKGEFPRSGIGNINQLSTQLWVHRAIQSGGVEVHKVHCLAPKMFLMISPIPWGGVGFISKTSAGRDSTILTSVLGHRDLDQCGAKVFMDIRCGW